MKIVESCVQRRNTFEIGFKKVTAIAKKRIGIEPVQAAQEQMIRVHKVVTDCWKITWSKRKNLGFDVEQFIGVSNRTMSHLSNTNAIA